MTTTLQPPPAKTPDAGVIEEARARQRAHRRAAGAAVTVVAATVAILLVSIAGGGSRAPSASLSHRARPIRAGKLALASCGFGKKKALQGAPSRPLLSTIGVLRQPASPADMPTAAIEKQLLRGPVRGVFVRYIRRAVVGDGHSYWIYPAILDGCEGKPHEGIMETTTHVNLGHGIYGSEGNGGADAAQIKRGMSLGSTGNTRQATLTAVVPDGVASVTFSYPAEPASGFSHKVLPAVAITAPVRNNLVIATVPRGAGTAMRVKRVWHSANGEIIKTISTIHET